MVGRDGPGPQKPLFAILSRISAPHLGMSSRSRASLLSLRNSAEKPLKKA